MNLSMINFDPNYLRTGKTELKSPSKIVDLVHAAPIKSS